MINKFIFLPACQHRDIISALGYNVMEIPEKKYITLANGEIYAYLEQGDKKPEKPSFLLLHGNSSSSVHYLPLFKRLVDSHLLSPDLRGFGDSSYNSGFGSLSELAEDIKLFTETLNISKVHVAGWSAGGGVALELAARYPSLVASLFLIQGMGYKGYPLYAKKPDGTFRPYSGREELARDPVLIAPALAAYESKDFAFFERLWNLSIYILNKPSEDENKLYISETLKQRNLVDFDWALAIFNMSDEHNGYVQGSGTIGNIRCPTVITSAKLDKLVPPGTARENAAAIRNAKLLEYENCAHSPLVDCPDRLAADILAHTGINTDTEVI